MRATLIRDLYGVEVDNSDWPKGMTMVERDALVQAVRVVLERNPQGLESWVLEEQPEVREVLRGAQLRDWRSAVVERACRALGTAEKRWVLPAKQGV